LRSFNPEELRPGRNKSKTKLGKDGLREQGTGEFRCEIGGGNAG